MPICLSSNRKKYETAIYIHLLLFSLFFNPCNSILRILAGKFGVVT